MLIEAPSLFDLTETSKQVTEPPRCRMCVRPARWSQTKQAHDIYCGSQGCANRERICQRCGATFNLGVDGAGTKYCSTECKAAGYRPQSETNKKHVNCAWCGQPGERKGGNGKHWPYICRRCLEPIKHAVHVLKHHHVSAEIARRLITNPGCEICGRDLIARTRDFHSGQMRIALVVDHDHACCPSNSTSCGACVRGFLCRQCNVCLGLLKDDPAVAQNMVDYLRKNR